MLIVPPVGKKPNSDAGVVEEGMGKLKPNMIALRLLTYVLPPPCESTMRVGGEGGVVVCLAL